MALRLSLLPVTVLLSLITLKGAFAQLTPLTPTKATDAALTAATGLTGVTIPRVRGNATVLKTEQSRTRLMLEIRLTGMPAAARKLVVAALDSAGRRDTRITPVEIDLTGSAEVTLEGALLTLAPNTPAGVINTSQLLVYAVSGSGKTVGLLQSFTCPHSWLQTPATLRATPLGPLPVRDTVDIAYALTKAIAGLENQLVALKAVKTSLPPQSPTSMAINAQIVAIEQNIIYMKAGVAAQTARSAPPPSAPLPRGLQRGLVARAPDVIAPGVVESDGRFQQALLTVDAMMSGVPSESRLNFLRGQEANFQAQYSSLLAVYWRTPQLAEQHQIWFLLQAARYRLKASLTSPAMTSLRQELNRLLEETSDEKKAEALKDWFDKRWSKVNWLAGSASEKQRFYEERLLWLTVTNEVQAEQAKMKPVDAAKGVPEGSKDLGAKGPGVTRFELNNAVEVNYQALSDRGQGLSVAPYIFQDANPASGVYYYLPARYLLDWRPETGFGLKLYYDQAGAADPVRITLDLRAALNPDDVKITTEVVRAICSKNKLPFQKLEPYRFSAVTFKLDQALAANLGLSQQKIFVQGYAENGTVRTVIGASVSAKDLFWNLLTRGGINGAIVEYSSAADSNLKIQVPVEIKLPDRGSFGTMRMESNKLVRNTTPFPLTLKYVHVLNFVSGKPTIFTFGLPENEIRPGGEIAIDRAQIPDWLDGGRLGKLWLEYDIVPSTSALAGVETMATSQALSQSTSEFSLEKVGTWPTNVKKVDVQIISKFFHPTGASEKTMSAAVSTDGASKTLGPVYLRGRQEGVDMGSANTLARYVLAVTYADGAVKRTPTLSSNYLTIPIGSEQIGQAR